jgi:hypothetical protein
MPGKIYPNEKKKLMGILKKSELEMIKKDYPFKKARNAKIHELVQKGISPRLLSELIGLSHSSVWRIGVFGDQKTR